MRAPAVTALPPAETVTVTRSPEPTLARVPDPVSPSAPEPTRWPRDPDPVLARFPVVSPQTKSPTYDDLVDELRRDLLRQRERIGDILGDLPWR